MISCAQQPKLVILVQVLVFKKAQHKCKCEKYKQVSVRKKTSANEQVQESVTMGKGGKWLKNDNKENVRRSNNF